MAKAFASVAVAMLCWLGPVCAQTPSGTTFRSDSQLVLVPTVVMEHGEYVRGLTKSNFVVLHNRKPEKIAVFEEIDAVPAATGAALQVEKSAWNVAPGEDRQDTVILLLDFLNATPVTAGSIRRELPTIAKGFLDSHAAVAVLILSYHGLVPVHTVNDDLSHLQEAIELWQLKKPLKNSSTADPSVGYSAPLDPAHASYSLQQYAIAPEYAPKGPMHIDASGLDRYAMTVRAVEQIAQAFRGVPGRKKLIWITSDLPEFVQRAAGVPTELAPSETSLRLWKTLMDGDIVVYPVLVNQLQAIGGFSPCGSAMSPEFSLVYKTGGSICNDKPELCVKRALSDAQHYYVLGFYLPRDTKPGWHELQVRARSDKYSVRSRTGFIVSNPAAPSAQPFDEKDFLANIALASPLDYTALPLKLVWTPVIRNGQSIIELTLTSPPGNVTADDAMSVDVSILTFIRREAAERGQYLPATVTQTLTPPERDRLARNGFVFRTRIPLAPGRYGVRVLVRDNASQKIGSVSAEIDFAAPVAQK